MISNDTSIPLCATMRASEDLRRTLGHNKLIELVCEAMPSPAKPAAAPPSEKLLALLTYGYAAGVYDSAEIPHQLDARELRRLGTEVPADYHVLRQFRRNHRAELRNCLCQVLRSARTQVVSYGDRSLNRWSGAGKDICTEEADERINRAIRADTFAMDD